MVHPRTKVLQRRRDVTSLLVRGFVASEIAEALNLPRQTVYNDIRVIRSGKNEALYAFTKSEINAQLHLNVLARGRKLWEVVDNTPSDYTRVYALKEHRLNDERIVRKLPPVESPRSNEAKIHRHIKSKAEDYWLHEIEMRKKRLAQAEENKQKDKERRKKDEERERMLKELEKEREKEEPEDRGSHQGFGPPCRW
jgi:hypothetical protein